MAHIVSYQDIPPEILAGIFELGVFSWGIGFLPSLCLVCNDWNNIITSTPRLWGIINIGRDSSDYFLNSQIDKVKASPLSIFIDPRLGLRRLRSKGVSKSRIIERLLGLAPNWVRASITTHILSNCRWADIRPTLEELHLSKTSLPSDIEPFLCDSELVPTSLPKLHTLRADDIPCEWVFPFLTPNIRSFRLHQAGNSRHNVAEYLSQIPCVINLGLSGIQPPSVRFMDNQQTVLLRNLTVLELSRVGQPSFVLSQICAPNLQSISIERTPIPWLEPISEDNRFKITLSPFFAQWSQPTFLPSNLHSLKLVECLRASDVEFLIRWLSRLPNLVQLTLVDNDISAMASQTSNIGETNLCKALASPHGARPISEGWLCPALTILNLEIDLISSELVSIAKVRGKAASSFSSSAPPPSRLHRLRGLLCLEGIEELEALVDIVECCCLGCSIKILRTSSQLNLFWATKRNDFIPCSMRRAGRGEDFQHLASSILIDLLFDWSILKVIHIWYPIYVHSRIFFGAHQARSGVHSVHPMSEQVNNHAVAKNTK